MTVEEYPAGTVLHAAFTGQVGMHHGCDGCVYLSRHMHCTQHEQYIHVCKLASLQSVRRTRSRMHLRIDQRLSLISYQRLHLHMQGIVSMHTATLIAERACLLACLLTSYNRRRLQWCRVPPPDRLGFRVLPSLRLFQSNSKREARVIALVASKIATRGVIQGPDEREDAQDGPLLTAANAKNLASSLTA